MKDYEKFLRKILEIDSKYPETDQALHHILKATLAELRKFY